VPESRQWCWAGDAFRNPLTPRAASTMRGYSCRTLCCALHHNLARPTRRVALWKRAGVLFSSVCLECGASSHCSVVMQRPLRGKRYRTRVRAHGRMHTALYLERDRRKPWKFQYTLSRRATARAASGGLHLLLVSPRGRTAPGPNFNHRGVGQQKTPKRCLIQHWCILNSEHRPTFSGFLTAVFCSLELFCIFQKI
jgi:hypothetical protein